MAEFVFKLPDLGEGVVESEVVAWHVKPGDYVKEDQPLVDLMTDKATVTIPSTVHGKVVRTNGHVGDRISVGSELIVFDLDAVPAADKNGASTSSNAPAPAAKADGASHSAKADAIHPPKLSTRNDDAPVLASPATRRRAKELGIDLSTVKGSGPGGRITPEDLDQFVTADQLSVKAPPIRLSREAKLGKREIPLVGVRRRIAERMEHATHRIPHFSYWEEIDVTELSSLRDHLNAQTAELYPSRPRLTFLSFILAAVARSLQKHPECNAHFDDQRQVIIEYESINLGIAAQTKRGLMVPVIKHVESMDIWTLAYELKRLGDAAKAGTATKDELTGSTFTVTSLGKLGGLGATPIINPPEVGIIGVHKVEQRPFVRNGSIVARTMLNLSCSFDHRVVDGMNAAQAIQSLKDFLEYPATIFIDG